MIVTVMVGEVERVGRCDATELQAFLYHAPAGGRGGLAPSVA